MAAASPFRLEVVSGPGPGRVTLDGEARSSITAALGAARHGSVVEIGRGRYGATSERLPLRIPAGVTVRGPAPPDLPTEARKHLPTPVPAALTGPGPLVQIDGDDVHLAHLRLVANAGGVAVDARNVRHLRIEACALVGDLELAHVEDARILWTDLTPGRIRLLHVDGAHITGGRVEAPGGVGATAITVQNGSDARIEAAAITEARTGVSITDSRSVLIGACAVLADDCAVEVRGSRDVQVAGNRLRASRTVVLADCEDAAVNANGIERADTGVALERCRATVIGANHFGDVCHEIEES